MPEQSRQVRKNSLPKSAQLFTQVRIDDETFAKGKILAAIYGESFNHHIKFTSRLMVRGFCYNT